MDWLNNNSMLLAQRSLDVTWTKQKMALDNIANVDTPGYKAKYVLFEDELKKKLYDVHQLHLRDNLISVNSRRDKISDYRNAIQNTQMRVKQSEEESMRMDGNNVNLDVEELEIARNAYQYQFALRHVSDQLARLRLAIEGR